MIGYPNPIRGKVLYKNSSTCEDGGWTLQVMWAPEDLSYTELTSIAINTPYKRVIPHFVNLEDKALITCPLPTPRKRKFLRSPIFFCDFCTINHWASKKSSFYSVPSDNRILSKTIHPPLDCENLTASRKELVL